MKTPKNVTVATGSLRQKCIKCNVGYEKARKYKYRHPELCDEQVIIHYRPDCCINILGELVIPEK